MACATSSAPLRSISRPTSTRPAIPAAVSAGEIAGLPEFTKPGVSPLGAVLAYRDSNWYERPMREFNTIVIAQSIIGAREKTIASGAKPLAIAIRSAKRINDANDAAPRPRVADP